MSSPLDRLKALSGQPATGAAYVPNVGRRRQGVRPSKTIQRIVAIPRRVLGADHPEAVDLLTEAFRQPRGEQTLRLLQALGLVELHDFGGLFAPMAVGTGKTLLTFLGPTVIKSKKPLLLVPAALREKTIHEASLIRRHWQVPKIIRAEGLTSHPGNGEIALMSYEWLSRENGAVMLAKLRPDFIIADECQKLQHTDTAVTKRVKRYVAEFHPACAFLSGTIAARSVLNFAHLLEWSLPLMNPTPTHYLERQEWSLALDEKVSEAVRLAPGALEALMNDEEKAKPDGVRHAFRRRLVETPGVVATSETEIGVSLRIELIDPGTTPDIDKAFTQLRKLWELPCMLPIPDPPAFWRHCIELSLGFYYRWKVQPPAEWLSARRAWCSFVNDTLKHNRRQLDSELQVARACERGEYDQGVWKAWTAVRKDFVPDTEAVWVSTHVLDLCVDWLKKNPTGILWVSHVQFGNELAKKSGVPYYGAGGKDERTGRSIVHAEEGKPMIASVASNSEGRNLQAWDTNLITHIVPQGKQVEQALGRTHRPGQEADEVSVQWFIGCAEAEKGFKQARADAKWLEDSLGSKQKLCYADICELATDRVGPRWM